MDAITAFLRIGTKYELEDLRSETIHILSARYPSDLQAWDSRPHPHELPIQIDDAMCFKAANIAQEIGLLSILPACLYDVCTCGYSAILDGLVVNVNENGEQGIAALTPETFELAIRGFLSLQTRQLASTHLCLHSNSAYMFSSCRGDSDCENQRRRIFQVLYEQGPRVIALDRLDDHIGALCDACQADCINASMLGRMVTWAVLPKMFGLPPWEEI